MLSTGANEVWFRIVSCEPRQRAQSDPDFGSGPETRPHRADHMRESACTGASQIRMSWKSSFISVIQLKL